MTPPNPAIEIVEPGPYASVQDAGRIGYAALGVPRSGAFDRGACALANRLVGNPGGAAVIETSFGGLAVRARSAATLALAGAPCPGMDWGAAITVPAGTLVRLGHPAAGVRSYLAVRGGITVTPVLGSRSTDTLSGLGPAPLRAGDVLPVGAQPEGPVGDVAAVPAPAAGALRLVTGPRDDWFDAAAPGLLTTAAWTVQPESNRIGVRLAGPRLTRAIDGELPSEPTLPGAIQVPPDGQPIVLGPDAPVTGGYPVIAVLTDRSLDVLAQARPGTVLRLRT